MDKSPSEFQKDFYICGNMRMLSFLLLFFLVGCQSMSKEDKFLNDLTGDWVLLYPDHQLKNEDERKIYGKIQDSIVSEKSLKLIRFMENGVFRQMDNQSLSGRWDLKANKSINIQEAGDGFENFKTNFVAFEDGVLQLSETVNYKAESLRLIWHFKKVDKKTSEKLFSTEANTWRIKPKKAETNEEIKNRLATILKYYSTYYNWVAEAASFFIGKRIILPLAYYQNAIGMIDFDPESEFAKLFFDKVQAEKAYEYLQDVIAILRNSFVKKPNFVKGYSMHLETMAERIIKLP